MNNAVGFVVVITTKHKPAVVYSHDPVLVFEFKIRQCVFCFALNYTPLCPFTVPIRSVKEHSLRLPLYLTFTRLPSSLSAKPLFP